MLSRFSMLSQRTRRTLPTDEFLYMEHLRNFGQISAIADPIIIK